MRLPLHFRHQFSEDAACAADQIGIIDLWPCSSPDPREYIHQPESASSTRSAKTIAASIGYFPLVFFPPILLLF